MTIAQAMQFAQSLGLDRLDAQLLVLHALGRTHRERAWLLAHGDDAMPATTLTQLKALAARRATGEPLAYITGHKEFYGLSLQVDARVLDPRADTETLVDWALEVIDLFRSPGVAENAQVLAGQRTDAKSDFAMRPNCKLIDLGTGSGAIALAIKHSRPLLQVHALDFCNEALAVASANAQRLALDVQFHQGSWLQGLDQQFFVIVSNPPYIAAQDAHLADLTHEPLQALASGDDGLDDIRTIIAQAPAHLLPGGWLLLEHGYDQAATVRTLLQSAGFARVESRLDLAGIERCSGGQWPGSALQND